MLGDGYMRRMRSGAWMRLGHGQSQLQYLLHKQKVLEDLPHAPMETFRKGTAIFHQVRWHTRADFGDFYDLLYSGGRKQITPESIELLDDLAFSYWFGDDGTIHKDDRPGFNASDTAKLLVSTKLLVDEGHLLAWLRERFGPVGLSERKGGIWVYSFRAEGTQYLGQAINRFLATSFPEKVIRQPRMIQSPRWRSK